MNMEKRSTSGYDFDILKTKKALVIGDLIIDYYRYVKEKKLSPEAPVIVFTPVKEEIRAGGAANVANNLSVLGFDVSLFSAMGKRTEDEKFVRYLSALSFDIFCVAKDRTTVKERISTKRQPVTRIDDQCVTALSEREEAILKTEVFSRLSEFSVVVFSDYDQGVLTRGLVRDIMIDCLNKGIPTVVNSKARDFRKYQWAYMSIFNHNEARELTALHEFSDEEIASFIWKEYRLPEGARKTYSKHETAVALTRGPEGILLCTSNRDGVSGHPVVDSHEDEVIDVTGAGDTVTSAVTAGIVMGLDFQQQMLLGNIAASVVIKKRGTSCASPNEINEVKEKIDG